MPCLRYSPAATVAALLLLALPAEAAPSAEACAAARTGMATKPAPQGRAVSRETAAALAQVKASKNGSAAPNAEAQAMLGILANMSASRGDPDSMAAAAALRAAAGRPGAAGGDAMSAALAKLGCR
jgi:hypothetical protein